MHLTARCSSQFTWSETLGKLLCHAVNRCVVSHATPTFCATHIHLRPRKVVTGLMRRPDRDAVSKIPIGVVPCGSANMYATALHARSEEGEDPLLAAGRKTQEGRQGWAALTVALQRTRKADVLELTTHDGHKAYAMSTVGWGAAGVMVAEAEKQAWLRSQRYWFGAALGLLTEKWKTTSSTRTRLAYPKGAHCTSTFRLVENTPSLSLANVVCSRSCEGAPTHHINLCIALVYTHLKICFGL